MIGRYDTFVVMDFSLIDKFFCDVYDKRTNEQIELNNTIVEVACVKVSDIGIVGTFSTYIAVDGYNASDLRIEDCSEQDITADHLIHAPSMAETVRRVAEFAKSCTIVVRELNSIVPNAFEIFKKYASSIGVEINNPVLSVAHLNLASIIKEMQFCGEDSVFEIADACLSGFSWDKVFEEHHIHCDGASALNRALALTKLFVDLVSDEWMPF